MLRVVSIVVLLAVAGCVPAPVDDGCAAPTGAGTEPTRVAINHDRYQARHIGHTADGRQFFLTRPFDVGTHGDDNARAFVALYLFDAAGTFVSADIAADSDAAYAERLARLGKVTLGRIEVEPFAVRKYGLTFGLVAHEPQNPGDIWWVTAEPGDYMAFSDPWDCGFYDT